MRCRTLKISFRSRCSKVCVRPSRQNASRTFVSIRWISILGDVDYIVSVSASALLKKVMATSSVKGVVMRNMRFTIILATLVLVGCASIPPEAPELSAQLGARVSALEAAHVRLLEDFFREKRRRVDDFVQGVWVPIFAQEFFADQKIGAVWKQVVESQDPNDRLRFITIVGPKLQEKISRKRIQLIQPLDELEAAIKNKIKSEYDQARAINTTLTAFLQSASKVEENRKRYLDMVGITDKVVDSFVHETDRAVSQLVDASRNIEDRAKDAEQYREKIKAILSELRK